MTKLLNCEILDFFFRFMMDTADVEFLAEKLPITIVPNFTQEKLYLISGDVGPFIPGENASLIM